MRKASEKVVSRHAVSKSKETVARSRTALGNIKKTVDNIDGDRTGKMRLRSSSERLVLEGRQSKKPKEAVEGHDHSQVLKDGTANDQVVSNTLRALPKRKPTRVKVLSTKKKVLDPAENISAVAPVAVEQVPFITPVEILGPIICSHDINDEKDALACHEYAHDIFEYNRNMEDFLAPTVYMHAQNDLTGKMRTVLVDWIIEVHEQLELDASTLHLTCNIIDRYLMIEQVHRTKFQLIGVAALLISSKHEEIYPPDPEQCVQLTDNAYTKKEVLETEYKILTTLQFDVTVPTVWSFMRRIHKVAKSTQIQMQRTNYYSQRCLQEHDMLAFQPSMIAASCVWLARLKDETAQNSWPRYLEEYCRQTAGRMRPCASMIITYLNTDNLAATGRILSAVKDKYVGESCLEVAKEVVPILPSSCHSDGMFQITV